MRDIGSVPDGAVEAQMLAYAIFISGALAIAAPESSAPPLAGGLIADKAYALIDGCEGLAVHASEIPQMARLSDGLDQRFVLRRSGGDVQFEAIGRPMRLRAGPSGLGLSAEGDVFRLQARASGQFDILGPEGAPIQAGDCKRPWRIEAFPVISPTKRVVWVDKRARQAGDGTRERPHANIQAAITRARPGDFIKIAPGIYREHLLFTRSTSGTQEAWIVLAASEPLKTLVIGKSQEPVIDLRQAHHIEINGLVLTNTGTGDCLYGRGGSHHRVIGLYVSGCGGGGIGLTGDFETIEGNVTSRNAMRSIWQNNGITIWQAKAAPLKRQEMPQTRLFVRRNASFLNDNHVLAPGSTLVTDGNGIILDDGRNTQGGSKAGVYPHRALVEHNLVFANGGSGLRVFRTDRVTLRFNTSYGNDRSKLVRGSGQAEIGSNECFDCLWTGNLAVKPLVQGRQRIVFDYNTRSVRYVDNVFFDPRPGISLAHREGPSAAKLDLSRNITDAQPVFANPALDETASFVLVGWEGRALEDKGQIGANLALIPPLARPDVLKEFDESGEAPQ